LEFVHEIKITLISISLRIFLQAEIFRITRSLNTEMNWSNFLFCSSNEASTDMTRALPDSITTWVISGVSVSQNQGMCVAVPTNITSKKHFFVHVDLPYAAVKTEQLQVKATVYNLSSRKLSRVGAELAGVYMIVR
jgi:outer membrane receptor for ferrienterochelin and colicin